ncbi:MAG TPA: recombinase family protein, partial [Streptosporangiaceae bacterium]|nr:recombinase family protein [Streptosporangiaceae bacterium]
RSLDHLIELSKELQDRGVDLVVLDQGIDTTTPAGRFLFHVIGAMDVISSSPDDQASDLGRSVADGVFDLAA